VNAFVIFEDYSTITADVSKISLYHAEINVRMSLSILRRIQEPEELRRICEKWVKNSLAFLIRNEEKIFLQNKETLDLFLQVK